nr:hypothetical protein CFP56_03128 [Quercus suber]
MYGNKSWIGRRRQETGTFCTTRASMAKRCAFPGRLLLKLGRHRSCTPTFALEQVVANGCEQAYGRLLWNHWRLQEAAGCAFPVRGRS